MEINLILAGVGGQGILTIAQAICSAAMNRGWSVKQSEVHGMAQRGGAVQSHLRIADHELYSDLIPHGRADMVVATEPVEALRYVHYLGERGTVIASTVPFINIPDYPPIEEILARIARFPQHVLVDADRLARAAGSGRAANTVILGAASALLGFNPGEIEAAVGEMFKRKGPAIVQLNQRACRFGQNAASAYTDGLRRGATAQEVRHWIETLPPEQLAEAEPPEVTTPALPAEGCELSRPETHAVAQMLERAYHDGRRQLYEHEVYRLVELVGAISPPRHHFMLCGDEVSAAMLDRFPGDKVVLKLVSRDVVHKTEAGGVIFVPKEVGTVNREMKQLILKQRDEGADIEGVLVVEFVERSESGFGQELFVGIRSTREFGAIIAAGLGGVDTEYLASKMKPGIAVAKALAVDTSPEEFFELFKWTAAYEVLAGRARGHQRVVSDGELLRCFRAFIAVARRFCVDRGEEGPDLRDLEVNPFAFVRQRMVPLDGRGRLGPVTKMPIARPLAKMPSLLEPRSIAVLGVSTKRANFGRIIVDNIKDCGFPLEHLYIIKEGAKEVAGVRCVSNLGELPEAIDLLVIAAASGNVPKLMDEAIASKKIASAILIPGGMGETEGTKVIEAQIQDEIVASRSRPDGGPIVLGGNCLGVRSRPGRYDTFFVPQAKLDARRDAPPRPVVLISQSGAFIISRMSNLEFLDPTLAVSLGNQIDLTISDILRAIGDREGIDCIAVYVEGFNDLDGLAFVRAVEEVTAAGKVVIFYKAGRTAPGRAATAGHTASVAGDYDVCQTAVANAGAIVTDTFKEFEQLMELATSLHGKTATGRRIGAMSNAGFETVGMADAILGTRYQLEIPPLSEATARRIAQVLTDNGLASLVNVRNPLDTTPMANEKTYEGCIRAMIEDESIDAVIASVIPLTPQMLTTADEISGEGDRPRAGSLVERLPALFKESTKPLICVIDAGASYDVFARAIRAAGVPVFRTCDQAVRSLGRYLCHRSERAHVNPTKPQVSETAEAAGLAHV